MSTLLFVFAWRASSRASARRREVSAQVEQAWREGARAVLVGRGRETSAAELAEAMQIDETEADELLTELAAHDEARVAIDTGDVKYRIDSAREREEVEAESPELERKRRL